MKTKLFSLFIAVLLFSFSGIAQNPVITLIGSGNGGWTDTAETTMLTADGITYTLVDKVLTAGEVKFREGKCWEGGCAATVGNKNGWGPTLNTITGWPSGSNTSPQPNGPNIQSQAGQWNVTFNRLAGSWAFTPGTPLPVIKVVGAAVVTPGGATLTTADGILFSAKKVAMVVGNCQFSVDGNLLGGTTWPNGSAVVPTSQIPVPTAVDYDVTFDYSTGAYTFKVATFPSIALVGSAAGGWPTGAPGEVDDQVMTTTDGITYTLKNIPIVGGADKKCLFRGGNDWAIKYGSSAFPSGTNAGGQDIEVFNTTSTGTYNITLNAVTGAYNFTKITYAIVGEGVGGWPPNPQPVGYTDPNQLSTVDGINYTNSGLIVVGGGAKFRLDNAWAGGDWGGDAFPAGAKTGGNIPTVAGTYNLTVNVLTGAYNFGTALSVKNFNAASFKAYPNPTRDSWNIVAGNEDITSVMVFDVLGKAVYSTFGAAKEVNVNASELSRGVYFAKVVTANGESTLKLVKE